MLKTCTICNKEFEAKGSGITCSLECSKLNKYYKRKTYKQINKEDINSKNREWAYLNKDKISIYGKKYRDANKDKIREHWKSWNEKNIDHRKQYKKEYSKKIYNENKKGCIERVVLWAKANPDKVKARGYRYRTKNKDRLIEYYKTYRDKNKTRILANRSRKYKFRIQNDFNFKFIYNVRQWFSRAFKYNKKSSKTTEYVDYSIEEFKEHIQNQFKEGMSWDNWTIDGWHVDHIKPISKFNLFNIDGTENIDQIRECFSLNNLQPLWARENMSKGNRLNNS